MMVRKDWPELVTLTNKVLNTLTEQEKQKLREKWFSVRFDYGYWRTFAIYALAFATSLLLGLTLFWFWNKGLKKDKVRIQALLDERERMVGSLLKANKTAATGALSASIAHELNQPLGASNLNIQFLKMKLEKGALNPELGKEILDSLEQDNKRAATIVKSLRSIFTDDEANAHEVQLGDLVSKVLDIVKPELKSKNIKIQLRVDDDLVIKVNPAEIEQVILNLVSNAVQALDSSEKLQRRIVIEASKAGKSVQLSVSDNGIGVSPEFKSQLFELLSTTKQTGMGLGLWLCKHIVTRYGGSIHHEDLVDGGASFIVKFPPLIIGSRAN
jgi:signal transduction histidine kinase